MTNNVFMGCSVNIFVRVDSILHGDISVICLEDPDIARRMVAYFSGQGETITWAVYNLVSGCGYANRAIVNFTHWT